MKIRTQSIITTVLFGIVLAVIAVSLAVTDRQVDRLNQQEGIALEVERAASDLSYLSNDYLLYGESQQRARWLARFASISEQVAQLDPPSPEQKAIVDNIKANQARLSAVFAEVASTIENVKSSTAAPDIAFVQVSWSRLQVQDQEMVFNASLLWSRMNDEEDRVRQENLWLVFALVGAFGIYLVANYWTIYRRALSAIAALHAGTRVIGSGNLNYVIPVQHKDEIGELARAFNQMTSDLKHVTATKQELTQEIAERELAEQRVRESEQKYRSIIETANEGIWITDHESKTILVNRRMSEMIGYTQDEIMGKPFGDFIDPDQVRQADERHTAREQGISEQYEFPLRRKDGTLLWTIVSSSPLMDGSGRVIGHLGMYTDITKRKHAEEEAKNLAKFPGENPNPVMRLDSAGAILYANAASAPWLKAWGVGIGETVPEFWRSLVAELCANRSARVMDVDISGKVYSIHAVSFADEGYVNLYGRDITIRKQAEERNQALNEELEQQAEELQQANLQLEETLAEEQVAREQAQAGRNILESLMRHSPEILMIAEGPDLRILMMSQYAETLLGYPLERFLGVPGPEHPFRRSLYRAGAQTPMPINEMPLLRALRNGETTLDYEFGFLRPDGEMLTILSSAGPIRDRAGRVTGAIAAWRDMSVRKRSEEKIQELNSALERRAVELEIANRELESFSYSVSHDLRAPLASITGFAAILLDDYGPSLQPEALRFVNLIHNNSLAMSQLVEGLLNFSRSIRLPVNRQMVDVNTTVNQVLNELEHARQGRSVEIMMGNLGECEADPILIKQVWVNLLSNALKFTRQRERARIEIDAHYEDGECIYCVRDNGVGFDPDQADRLFGVFQRLHSEDEYEGTGVGLAVVERVVRRHGGRIWAEAEPNKGATFFFTLPVKREGK